MGDDDAALEHQLLDFTKAEREAEVQPHAVRDHLDRIAVPLYDGDTTSTNNPLHHDQPEDHPTQSANVTAPLGQLLLEQCLASLADRGVREVTGCLAAPTDDQPHLGAVLDLHTAAGFDEIDQLHAYTRRP
ncbi:hypothetical protein ACF08N_38110 [Streptomyces sp. NPDC015127]|uniref:hypothetical protein n=1 Tax=Streptomyces sp. NPDC015127 TaxID=3364939 RepID=UPI0037013366